MKDTIDLEAANLRNVDRKKVNEKIEALDQLLIWIHVGSITETNLLILVGADVVVELVGIKEVSMIIKTRYHGGNDAFTPVLRN